ncbi:MAG TPA: hypothetical protein VJ997_03880, partial [Longimicrobiales bacterium]|nr:hypothetical protein [Longimicrobiales bacterium]
MAHAASLFLLGAGGALAGEILKVASARAAGSVTRGDELLRAVGTARRGVAGSDELSGLSEAARAGAAGTDDAVDVGRTLDAMQWEDLPRISLPPLGNVDDATRAWRATPAEDIRFLSSLPNFDVRTLQRPVGRARLISAIPDEADEFRRIYGHAPSAAEEGQMRRLVGRLEEVQRLSDRPDHLRGGRDALRELIKSSDDSELLVVTAHSEDGGRVLVLTDGTRLEVTELHRACAAASKMCVTITCNGDDLGISG